MFLDHLVHSKSSMNGSMNGSLNCVNGSLNSVNSSLNGSMNCELFIEPFNELFLVNRSQFTQEFNEPFIELFNKLGLFKYLHVVVD